MDDVQQSWNLTPVIREFEGIIKDGNFIICNNNLTKAHFLNVGIKHKRETTAVRPIKLFERARIDGFAANIDAMTVRQKWNKEIGVFLKNNRNKKEREEGES
jgi:phage terminase large subunit-like protein